MRIGAFFMPSFPSAEADGNEETTDDSIDSFKADGNEMPTDNDIDSFKYINGSVTFPTALADGN